MDSAVTLRLDKQTRERVARIARQNRISASDVIREAIDVWLKNYEADARPYDSVSDLIGVVHGGKSKRSMQTGPWISPMQHWLLSQSGRICGAYLPSMQQTFGFTGFTAGYDLPLFRNSPGR